MVAVLDRSVAAALAVIVIVLVMMVAHFLDSLSRLRPTWRNGSLFRLSRMGQSVLNHVDDVLIGEGVVQVRAIAAADNEPFTAQEPQPLRDGGELFTERIHEFRHAALALHEVLKKTQPGAIPQRAKQAARLLQCVGAGLRQLLGGMFRRMAARVLNSRLLRFHISSSSEIINPGGGPSRGITAYFMK